MSYYNGQNVGYVELDRKIPSENCERIFAPKEKGTSLIISAPT
jgi:hypothetical protein